MVCTQRKSIITGKVQLFFKNLIENTIEFKTKSMEFSEHAHKILLNNTQHSSAMQPVENQIGIKKWHHKSEFNKKTATR